MSSSYIPSMNHSTESATSSMQRSGLNMSVGDTKSIVLALQALQDKIRRLEQDRNHHQDQYERALQSHEAYKQDMERQLEAARAHHRQRESELQEMAQRAAAERTRLQGTLEESRKDLGAFRTDLEAMLSTERDAAQQREAALHAEAQRLRRELEDERRRQQQLRAAVDALRAEKAAAVDANHRLERAVRGRTVGARPKRRPHSASAERVPPAPEAPTPAGGRTGRGGRRSYKDPTYASLQRGAGSGGGGNGSFVNGGGGNGSFVNGARRGPLAERQTGAMAEVHAELQDELKALHKQYRETVERAAAEDIAPEVVTAALQRISTLMDRKTEQVRLLKEAQRDFVAAGVVEVPTSRSASGTRRRGQAVGADKTTQRNLIVNELRALYAQQ